MGGVPAGAGSLVGQRLGKYQLLALLALGGTAEIYLARIEGTSGFEKYVVVKCLHDHLADDQEFVAMFLDEARLGATLDHSNIVQTLELGEQNGRYFMTMEFLAGMSLAMIARKAVERVAGGRIPVHLTLGLAAQTCAGLHYAHERRSGGAQQNIVHRDVSPQNLVVTFEGVVKIVDFGIAKAEHRETHTRAGTIKGKFAYMSPEQCRANDVDRRTDVFALGTIVHELITGRRLFKKSSTYDTYQAILDGKVPAPSDVNHELDPGLDPVILKALAYDREDRYPTAEAFGEALIGYLHQRGKHSGPGEVSRFFDQYYMEEIDEHGARMRELLEGREHATSLLTWDAADLASEVAARMPDDDDEPLDSIDRSDVVSLETGDVVMEESVSRSVSSMSEIGAEPPTHPDTEKFEREELDRDGDGDGDGDGEGEKTRIEEHPMGRDAARPVPRGVTTAEPGRPGGLPALPALPALAPLGKHAKPHGAHATPARAQVPVVVARAASVPVIVPVTEPSSTPATPPQGKRRNAPGTTPPAMQPAPLPATPPVGVAAIPSDVPPPPPSAVPTEAAPARNPRAFASAPNARTVAAAEAFDAPTVQRPAGFVPPELVSTVIHDASTGTPSVLTPPSTKSLVPPPSANPAGAMANVELPLPAHLISLPAIEQVFSTSELAAIERERNRKIPPWLLLLLFVGAVVAALVLTIALARALR